MTREKSKQIVANGILCRAGAARRQLAARVRRASPGDRGPEHHYKISYRKIYELTGVSTATITRVSRALQEGDGYKDLLDLVSKSIAK